MYAAECIRVRAPATFYSDLPCLVSLSTGSLPTDRERSCSASRVCNTFNALLTVARPTTLHM